jgi:predicted CXXCH cytochrome family protein
MRTSAPASLWPAVALLAVLAGAGGWWLWRGRTHVPDADEVASALPAGYPHTPVEAPAPPDDGDDYVGSAACAECHREIAEQFAAHPMSRSTCVVPEPDPLEKFGAETVFRPGGRRTYRVELADGRMVHHELQLDNAGQAIYDQGVPIDYAIGSGTMGRTYLLQRGDLLLVSPVSWYSLPRQWELSPGYGTDDPRRFEARAASECLYCHVGRVQEAVRGSNRYLRPAVLETEIGCERCHGPGRRHVALYRSGSIADRADPLIVNPAHLDKPRQDAICFQCHLQGKARVPRYGRESWDFRPGALLEETIVAYVNDPGVTSAGTTRSVSHVEQMLASRCYAGSQGRLGCVSCHDPHGLPAESSRREFYDKRCLACHESQDQGCALEAAERAAAPALGSCTSCHMPRRTTHDTAHASKTDHRIVRRPESDGELAAELDAGQRWTTHDDAEARLPRWEADRCRALAGMLRMDSSSGWVDFERAAHVLSDTTRVAPDDRLAWQVLGQALVEMDRPAEARRAFEAWLALDPSSADALQWACRAAADAGDLEAAAALGERLLAACPALSSNWDRQARVLAALGRTGPAIDAAYRALELDPTLLSLRELCADWLVQDGRTPEAQEQREIVRRLRQEGPAAE